MMFLQWYHGVLKSNHMSFRENVYVRTAPNIALHKQTTKQPPRILKPKPSTINLSHLFLHTSRTVPNKPSQILPGFRKNVNSKLAR